MVVKSIYFARRNPDTSHDEFLRNWRAHGRLAGTFASLTANFRGVMQCSAIGTVTGGPAENEFDGVNIMVMTSLLHAVEVWNDPNIEVMRTDELRVFSRYIRDVTVTGIETVLLDGPHCPYVVVDCFARTEGSSAESFISSWSGDYARAHAATDAYSRHVRRYVHNYVALPPPSDVDYDGVAEAWFDTEDAASAYVADKEIRQLNQSDAIVHHLRFLGRVNLAWPPLPAQGPSGGR